MSDSNAHSQDILDQWLSGELSDAEAQSQLDADDFIKYRQILSEVDSWQPSTDAVAFDLTEVLTLPKLGKQRFLSTWQAVSIAASFLLALMAGYFINQAETMYSTGSGQISEIILPDGSSKIVLAPNSSVRWKKGDWQDDGRQLSLNGKAHFMVNPGSPFKVQAGSGMVEVLGTSFDVNLFESSMHVICYEGKVRATSPDMKAILLVGGESSLYFDRQWETKISIKEIAPTWMEKEAKFSNAPISQVINEIKSYYDLEVNLGNINLQRRFTGSFPTDNLQQTLQIVFGTLGIEYKLDGNTLTLSE